MLRCPQSLQKSQGISSEENQHENRPWEQLNVPGSTLPPAQSSSPRGVNRLLSCNISRCSQLLGRWQVLPLVWHRFLASLGRSVASISFSVNKQEPCDLTGIFFVRHASEHTPNAFSLYVRRLLWTGKCGTHSSVSLSDKIAADGLCLFFRGVFPVIYLRHNSNEIHTKDF